MAQEGLIFIVTFLVFLTSDVLLPYLNKRSKYATTPPKSDLPVANILETLGEPLLVEIVNKTNEANRLGSSPATFVMHSKLTRQLIQLEPKWNERLRQMDADKRKQCLEVMKANKIPIDDDINQMAPRPITGPSSAFRAAGEPAPAPQLGDVIKNFAYLLHTPLKIGIVYFGAKLIFGSGVPFFQIPFFSIPPKVLYPLTRVHSTASSISDQLFISQYYVAKPISMFLSVVTNPSILKQFVFGKSAEEMGSFALETAPFDCKVIVTFGVITSWMVMAMAYKQLQLQLLGAPSSWSKISNALRYAFTSLTMSESTKNK